MSKKRTIGAQVRSGFRIAGCILLVFVVFTLLEVGLTFAVGLADPHTLPWRFFGAVLALGLMLFMFGTTKYWSRWLFSTLAYGLLRLTSGLLFAPYFGKPLGRGTVAVWVIYTGAAVALTVRYIRRHPRGFESFGLVSFVVGVAIAAVYNSQNPLWAGLALLGLAELVQRVHQKKALQSKAFVSEPPV